MPKSKKKNNNIVLKTSRWNKLSNNDLLDIIKTEHYAKLHVRFKRFLCSPRQLFKDSPCKFYDRALEHAIENSSAPLGSMFYLSFAITLVGDTALGLTTGAMGLTAIYGLYNYYINKKRSREERQNHIHYFQLAQLRLLAADTYLKRMEESIGFAETLNLKAVNESKFALEQPSLCSKLTPSLVKGMSTSITLLTSYYFSAMFLFETVKLLALSSAMLTPVGLGVAIGLALLAGIYCGYRHYKTMEANKVVEHRKDVLSEEVQMKKNECIRLSGFKQGLFYPKSSDSICPEGRLLRDDTSCFLRTNGVRDVF